MDKINGNISVTLIRSSYVKTIHQTVPNSQGIQWEHHPQENFDADTSGHELKSWGKNYGAGGTDTESSDFTIKFSKTWQPVNTAAGDNTQPLDVTNIVTGFINKRRDIIKTKNIHVLSLNKNLAFTGSFTFVSPEDCLEGTRYYDELAAKLSGKLKEPSQRTFMEGSFA